MLTWEHGWSRYYERLRIPLEVRNGIDRSMRAAGEAAVEAARGSSVAVALVGYGPAGGLGLIVLIVVILLLTGRIQRRV